MSRPPVPSRVYDALAGGVRHDPADAALAEEITAAYPGVRRLVRNNRVYLAHAALLASSRLGISQFLDLGSGFPGPGSVRDTAQQAGSGARVACADLDKAVARHGIRLALEGVKNFTAVTADIRDPAAVLAHERVAEVIDLEEPVCLVFGLVLQTMGPDEAREVVAGYAGRAAAGSCAVITVPRCDDEELFKKGTKGYPCELSNFTPDEVRSLFEGLEVLPPGVGPVAGTGPGWEQPGRAPGRAYVVGGIGVKR